MIEITQYVRTGNTMRKAHIVVAGYTVNLTIPNIIMINDRVTS
jgi:hypothetical protein